MTALPDKAALRRDALARRDALDAGWRAEASAAIAGRGLPTEAMETAGPVSGFWPIRSEIDPRPLMLLVHQLGRELALPVVGPQGLLFRHWTPGDRLASAGFGLSEPLQEAPERVPAVMLVPLAAFDRRGHRVGYGAGYYDRAIAHYAPLHTIGLAFSVQEVPLVPDEEHDRPLDWILTEREAIRAIRG
jgi:5-formyltetrahydrofolate cyclo-ligase